MSANLFIGTSGYTYSHWVGRFYPADLPRARWLEFYAKHFNSVEINYTFYHIPRESTLKKWRQSAPEGFLFVLKASKLITHTKNWKSAGYLLWKFLKLSEILQEKRGPILLQFPPSFRDKVALENLLEHIKPGHKVAVELRNEDILEDEDVRQMLAGRNIALCVSSSPRLRTYFIVTADFTYIRFHGARRMYSSSYTDDELMPFVGFAGEQLADGRDVFAYFNNDAEGYAIENAVRFRELISSHKM